MKKFIVFILLACVMTLFYACSDTKQTSKKVETSKQEQETNAEKKRLKEATEEFYELYPDCEILEIVFTDIRGATTVVAYSDNEEDPDTWGSNRVSVAFTDKDGASSGVTIGEKNLIFRNSGKRIEVVDKDTVKVNYYDSKEKKNKYMTFRFSYDVKKKATKFVTKEFIE